MTVASAHRGQPAIDGETIMRSMRIYRRIFPILVIGTLLMGHAAAQQKDSSILKPKTTAATGTANRVAKYVATGVLGDSNITEDKLGNVGIGTSTPDSPLTVAGMIEITLGGLKFPDGTMQTSAAVTNIFHSSALRGDGSMSSPLDIAVPLTLSGSNRVLKIESTVAGGATSRAFEVRGGNNDTNFGGSGIWAFGGNSGTTDRSGGGGVVGIGGGGVLGGRGVEGDGGDVSGAGKTSGDGVVGFPGQATNGATYGKAGRFLGDVEVTGTLTKGGGSFKIDHPANTENKYLSHSFVESPDMMNIYNGNITTDGSGRATVELPEWFEALNRDFRYQLTVVGRFAQAIVAEKVKDNRFTIETSVPGVEVSWQVTGIRQDAWANKNRIPVEELKSERERGHYLHPEAFQQPEEKSMQTVQFPERQLRKRR